MHEDSSSVQERIERIRARIAETAERCGRNPNDITLVAVSKTKPVQAILEAYSAGIRDFGENYAQELAQKFEALPKDIRWHMIGHLQTNKVKFVSGKASMFHALDSEKLASKLNARLERDNAKVLPVLIMVNVGKEPTKSGIDPEPQNVIALARKVLELHKLKLVGLMCLPPFFDDPEQVRPYFKMLRELKNRTEDALKIELPHLSMGMTHDFEVAIEEGATILRIGTAIFGPRTKG